MTGKSAIYSIEQPPLWRMVADQLRKLILTGELESGAHLVETELAEMTGVSRGPIRQALAQLEQEGFVEILPRQGTYVAELTRERTKEKYELRRLIEVYAAKLAAVRGTDEDLEDLRAHYAAMARAVDLRNTDGFYLAQYRFHLKVIEMTQMASLSKVWEVAGLGVGSLAILNLHYGGTEDSHALDWWATRVAQDSLATHDELITALASHDPDVVERVMQKHLELGEEAVLSAVDKALEDWADRSDTQQAAS